MSVQLLKGDDDAKEVEGSISPYKFTMLLIYFFLFKRLSRLLLTDHPEITRAHSMLTLKIHQVFKQDPRHIYTVISLLVQGS